MSQSVAFDITKLSPEKDSVYNGLESIHACSSFPPYENLMRFLESSEAKPSEELLDEMKNSVKQYADANNKGVVIEVKDMNYDKFAPEKIIAMALGSIDDKNKAKELVASATKKFEQALHNQSAKDFKRDGIIIEHADGTIDVAGNIEALKKKASTLTGEQIGYINSLASQSLLSGGTSMPLLSAAMADGRTLVAEAQSNNFSTCIKIEDGKVQVLSSRGLQEVNNEDKTESPTFRHSNIADISNLKGDNFHPMRASANVPVKGAIQSVGGGDKIIDDLQSNTPEEAKISDSNNIISQIDKVRESMPNPQITSAKIYADNEKEQSARLHFASEMMVKYSKTQNPNKDTAYQIMKPLVPENMHPKLKQHSARILRTATENKKLSFKDKIHKIFDRISMSVGIMPKEVKHIAKTARGMQHKSSKKGGFVQRLLARRRAAGQNKSRGV